MKKNEFFKRVIDDNIADKERILKNTLTNCNENKKCRSGKYKRLSFRLAAAILVFSVVLGYNLMDVSNSSVPKTANNTNPAAARTEKNSFKVFACAAENNNPAKAASLKIDESKKIELKFNTETEVPYGKISKGKLMSYVNEKGEKIKEYEVTFNSTFRLGWNGANIKSVTCTSINGELNYFDVDMLKKMKDNEEINICKIVFPNSKVGTNLSQENIIKTFYRMWKSGELDEYKNKYFGGKDIDLKNYGYSYGTDYTTGNSYIAIHKPEQKTPPYFQSGSKVKVNSNKDGVFVGWVPVKAMDILKKENSSDNYKDLPSDTITADVEFEDGQIITKTINLSFNKEGNLVIGVK